MDDEGLDDPSYPSIHWLGTIRGCRKEVGEEDEERKKEEKIENDVGCEVNTL